MPGLINKIRPLVKYIVTSWNEKSTVDCKLQVYDNIISCLFQEFQRFCAYQICYLLLKWRFIVDWKIAMAQGCKRITLKEALRMWEERGECPLEEAVELKLNGWSPPIEKIDGSTASIPKCEKLSLSTNMIERLANLNPLKNLRILSVGRNYLKSLSGVEACADTLEEIWASYNLIEKPSKGVTNCKKLRVLYLANNWIKDWPEVGRLSECLELQELILVGNPLEEKFSAGGGTAAEWQKEVSKKLLQIKKLDGYMVVREVEDPETASNPDESKPTQAT